MSGYDLVTDPEAVRRAVGVTDLDADNGLVNDITIAGAAEVKIKAIRTDWQVLLAGKNEQSIRLKLAAIYYASAMLCLRFETGGAIGLVEAGGGNVNWRQKYIDLMAMYGAVLGEIEVISGSDPNESLPDPVFLLRRTSSSPSWLQYPPVGYVLHPLIGENWNG